MIIALTGKPSSGKSSFFKAATLVDAKISPVPFTTLKPDTAVAYVTTKCMCKEFNVKCNPKHGRCENGVRFIPVRLWDLPGIVKGAHEGRGLGLQFLDSVRQASILIQVIDCSGLTDEEGRPASNSDPENEIKFLEEEIDLWFADVIKRSVEKFKSKLVTMSRSDLIDMLFQQLSGLEIGKQDIEDVMERASIMDIEKFAKELRKMSKPTIYAANKIDLKESQENFERLKGKYQNIVPTSAESEIALKKAAERELITYLSGNGFEIKDPSKLVDSQLRALEFIKNNVIGKYGSTGIQNCLNRAVFELLNYIAVYPVADANKLTDKDKNVLPDVFLVPNGIKMREFAFKVHTDLGEKFICGIDARTKRRLAADYQLKNNDVVEIAFAK
jgi:ribosome-binding ATPase YchF (GTP1/OBG family)